MYQALTKAQCPIAREPLGAKVAGFIGVTLFWALLFGIILFGV